MYILSLPLLFEYFIILNHLLFLCWVSVEHYIRRSTCIETNRITDSCDITLMNHAGMCFTHIPIVL